jgi:hypothetical protein
MPDYFDFLDEYCQFYEDLVTLEREKAQILAENHPYLLEQMIKQEEVVVMKAQGLEIRRLELQKESGFAGKTINEIIAALEGEAKERLQVQNARLQSAVTRLRALNQASADIIVTRLKSIEGSIQELLNSQESGGSLMNRSI